MDRKTVKAICDGGDIIAAREIAEIKRHDCESGQDCYDDGQCIHPSLFAYADDDPDGCKFCWQCRRYVTIREL